MFISLLVVTFLITLGVCFLLARVFKPAVSKILQRIVNDDIYREWVRYLMFAIYVVGISSGVRIWDLEKYISPTIRGNTTQEALALTIDRCILELYRTVIGTLQGVAWMLLVFFAFALIGFVIVRLGEIKHKKERE
jgi:hypothetical protein